MNLLGKFGAATLGVAAMLVLAPAQADAAVFTFNGCLNGDCSNVSGSISVTVLDNGNNLNFTVQNSTNGDLDYLRFLNTPLPTGTAQITNFVVNTGTVDA